MEISLNSVILVGAVITTGLSAGLFYAWSVSVIPGTQKIGDPSYLETMQSINREILNPAFFLSFFGSVALLGAAGISQWQAGRNGFTLVLTAFILYLFGTVGVTAMGNVPLNNQLDLLQLNQLSASEISDFRKHYEIRWNRLHQVRTLFALASFVIISLALLDHSNQ